MYLPAAGLGTRHTQTLLLFLSMLLLYCMRVNISLAIVDMTDTTKEGHFDWSHSVQSKILSSFFWGYIMLQVPAGELSRRYGGKIFLTISMIMNAAVSLITPLAVKLVSSKQDTVTSACSEKKKKGGWKLICACRMLQGFSQAFLFPATHHLVTQWIPFEERGLLCNVIYAGGKLGVALQLLSSGFIASAWGWEAIFYTNALLGAIWVVCYLMFGSASLETSKAISANELKYIQVSLGRVGEQKRYPTPWRSVVTSLPFLAAVVAHCGQNWGFFTLLTEIPTYMSKVLGMDIKKNGMLSSLPYLVVYLLSFPLGAMTDFIIKKNWLSVTNTRKLFNTIGLWGPALALIALSYTPAGNLPLAVAMLTLTVGINAGNYTGYLLIFIDIAPNFSASLIGISNFFASISVFFVSIDRRDVRPCNSAVVQSAVLNIKVVF
ncbi:PREDICTED: putative inorganic phosphate cotransporter [Papilio polytes]|uniref:putative inorganic phosphate cotransporter n=1 Tax=Papilio polytes TaxID=76194 RepID=UPI000676349E|nr:PREDICTED: putative inorganic phosphate cotransporter [Papilio polytes]